MEENDFEEFDNDSEQTKLLNGLQTDGHNLSVGLDRRRSSGHDIYTADTKAINHSGEQLATQWNDEVCSSLTVDQALDKVGSFGCYQIFLVVVLGVPSFCGGFQFLESSFTLADSPWQCVNGSEKCLLNGTFTTGDDNYEYRCHIARQDWQFVHKQGRSTAVMEWDLVCSRAILATIASSLVLIGCFFGNVVFGIIADKYGRKNPSLIALLTCSVIAFVGSFAPSYPLFALAKLLVGFGIGSGVCLFVLSMECCGVKHRATAGIINGMLWPLGLVILSFLAYIFTEWRTLCRALSAPLVIILIPLFWIVPESMRWNVLNGNISEAQKTLRKIAKHNGKEMPQDPLYLPPTRTIKSQSGNILDLFRTWNMARQTLIVWFGFLANGVVYYGVAMSSANLGGNKYLSFLISSAIEVPAHLLTFWLINRVGRKFSLVGGLLLAAVFAGTCALAFPIHKNEMQGMNVGRIVTAVLAKMSIVVSFISVYIFAAEIFPTTLRVTGVNTGSAAARIGAICAPYILYLGRFHAALPYSILGIAGLLAGLSSLTLHETRMTPTKEFLLKDMVTCEIGENEQSIELCSNQQAIDTLKD